LGCQDQKLAQTIKHPTLFYKDEVGLPEQEEKNKGVK